MKTPSIEDIKGRIDDYIILFEELLTNAKIIEGLHKLSGLKLPKDYKKRREQLELFLGFFYTFQHYLETGEMPEALDPVMELIKNLKEGMANA